MTFGSLTGQRVQDFVREYYGSILLTSVVLVISGLMHLLWYYSPLRLTEDTWVRGLDVHLSQYPFNTRLMQSQATLLVQHIFSLPVKESFMIVQGGLTMILGPLFYRYLRQLRVGKAWSLVGLFLLMTAYPILGAHFSPTYTWDDIWMYVFGVLCFSALTREEPLKASLYFTLGCFARGQMLLFLPIFVLSLWWLQGQYTVKRLLGSLLLPLLLYGSFRAILYQAEDPKRWELFFFNFRDSARSTDTIVSMIIAFGVMWFLCVVGQKMLRERPMTYPERVIFWGAFLSVPVVTITTLLFTNARETRIFFPPFVFVIPLSVVALRRIWDRVSSRCGPLTWTFIPSAVAVCLVLGVAYGGNLFSEWDFGRNVQLRRQIAGVHLGTAWIILQGWIISTLQNHISVRSLRRKDSSRPSEAIVKTAGTVIHQPRTDSFFPR